MTTPNFTLDDARQLGTDIGIDWATSPFDVSQFHVDLGVQLEHGSDDPQTNVTNNDPIMTGKIAWAHLKELPDYYTRLAVMEADAGS